MTSNPIPAPEYLVRYPNQNDMPFIYSAWAKAAHQADTLIPSQIFAPYQRNKITHLLSTSTTLLLMHPTSPTEHIGFICYTWAGSAKDILVIHWCYIRSMFRKMGLASHLLETLYPGWKRKTLVLSQRTVYLPDLARKLHYLVFDPITYEPPRAAI